MQNEPGDNQQLPSAAPPSEEAAPREETSGGSKGLVHFFDRVIHRGSGSREGEDEQPPDQTEPRTAPEPTEPAWKPPATRDEYQRQVQSAVDVELYRRQQLKTARDLEDLKTRAQRAFQEGDDLLGGELTRQAMELEQGGGADEVETKVADTVGRLSDFYDSLFLDGYLSKLEAATREELLREPIVGANGRALLASRIADALLAQGERVADAKAEARLRKNPSFRKEVLHDVRPGLEEPDHLPAVATGGSGNMDDFIRRAIHR